MATKNLRRNERIRVSQVRLIDQDNEQAGIVPTSDALARAKEAGLDLVEVAPQSEPPVCRIMDYGKWMYAQQKKERKARSKRHEPELKRIRIRTPKIAEYDLMRYVDHARGFLERGDRVQFFLRFRGRELAHIEEGIRVFERVTTELGEVGRVEQPFRREGRRITMLMVPLGKHHAGARKSEQATPRSPGEKAS